GLRALPWDSAPQALVDAAKSLLGSPRIGAPGLARLAALWRSWPQWRSEVLERLNTMLSADRKDWRGSGGLFRRLVRARRDYYRGAAKSIAARFVTIGIEKLSLAEMSTAENNPLPQLRAIIAALLHRRNFSAPSNGPLPRLDRTCTSTAARAHGFARTA